MPNDAFSSVLLAEPADKIADVLRHALADDVVVHGAQLLPDPGLDLAAQTGFRLMRLFDWPAHGFPNLRLARIWFALIRHRFTGYHFAIDNPSHVLFLGLSRQT